VWTVTAISIIVAAILLIEAIISLYIIKQPNKRLAMIACYTVLFALSVSLLTNA
jgi:hypothetical protein